ncbi:TPA: DUF551 domain-containing protein [Yersinia enterocolitica]
MKELDSFTVKEIEEIISSCQQEIHNTPTGDEMPVSPRILLSLARIALAAKRAEPVVFRFKYPGDDVYTYITHRKPDEFERERCTIEYLYTTPQLNSPEIPEGWIKCSDHKPDSSGEFLVYETLNNRVQHDYWVPDDCAALGLGFWNHYANYVTHWMPLPTAPEKENG